MPRKFTRKSSRKSTRRLSSRNIYMNRSSRSQALQIATLRNRVNRIYRACRPEVKTLVTNAETKTYTSQTISSYYSFYPMTSPGLGSGDGERIGNSIKVLNGLLYLSMEYFNNSTTGYHNTESSGCQYRIVIGQFKTKHSMNSIPSIGDLFEFPSNSGADYTQMALSPFKEGITAQYIILRDIRGILTTDRNQRMMKIPFKPKEPYVWNDSAEFNNCWACLIVTGLHYDNDFMETVKITVSDKLVFTDA